MASPALDSVVALTIQRWCHHYISHLDVEYDAARDDDNDDDVMMMIDDDDDDYEDDDRMMAMVNPFLVSTLVVFGLRHRAACQIAAVRGERDGDRTSRHVRRGHHARDARRLTQTVRILGAYLSRFS
jgi:hypothetical protein